MTLNLKIGLNALDGDTLPALISWLCAHPSSVRSQRCQGLEPCLRAACQHVGPDIHGKAFDSLRGPFQYLSTTFKQRTLDAYRLLTESALAVLNISRNPLGSGRVPTKDGPRILIAGRQLEEAWREFREQIQQNLLLGPQGEGQAAVFRTLNDPTLRDIGLSNPRHAFISDAR